MKMVYRKKRYVRRKTYGRKRAYRKKFNRRTRYSKSGQKLYMFQRYTGGLGTLAINNITPTLQAFNFSLNDLPNYTEFTALYDMYKINAIKITFIPQQDTNVSLSSVNNPFGNARFFSAIDYNDSTSPASVDELREYHTCKFTRLLKTHKRYIHKPKILDSSSYTLSPWIATSAPSTNYFGLKVAVEPMSSTVATTMNYSIEAKYYMTFKNVK